MNIEDEIIVIEDFFPKYFQQHFEKMFFDTDIDWHFIKTVTSEVKINYNNDNIKEDTAFVHSFTMNDDKYKELKKHIEYNLNQKLQVQIKEFLRARLRFSMPNPYYHNDWYLPPHVDLNIPHKTLIYYITDSEAETLFFNKQYTSDINAVLTEKCDIIKKVTPKKGSAVFFDGSIFHASRSSQFLPRMLLNLNFLIYNEYNKDCGINSVVE